MQEENRKLQLVKNLKAVTTKLEIEHKELQKELSKTKASLESFLSNDQIKMLQKGRTMLWPIESIIKGPKFRFTLSDHGYDFLRQGIHFPGIVPSCDEYNI